MKRPALDALDAASNPAFRSGLELIARISTQARDLSAFRAIVSDPKLPGAVRKQIWMEAMRDAETCRTMRRVSQSWRQVVDFYSDAQVWAIRWLEMDVRSTRLPLCLMRMFCLFLMNASARRFFTWSSAQLWFTAGFMKQFHCWPVGISSIGRTHGPDVEGVFWRRLVDNLQEIIGDMNLEILRCPDRRDELQQLKRSFLGRVLSNLARCAFAIDAARHMRTSLPSPELQELLPAHGFYPHGLPQAMDTFLAQDGIFENNSLEEAVRVADEHYLKLLLHHYSSLTSSAGKQKYQLLMQHVERIQVLAREEEAAQVAEQKAREKRAWWDHLSGLVPSQATGVCSGVK